MLKESSFKILLLQETKLDNIKSRFSRWLCGGSSFQCEAVEAMGRSGGLISCWVVGFFQMEKVVRLDRYLLLIGKLD